MNKKSLLQVLSACTALVLALSGLSCASQPSLKPAQEQDLQPAMAPAAKPVAKDSDDYLPANLIMAGIRLFSYQGDLYTVPFYTVEILTPASVATKNEALVKPTGPVADTGEKEFWTAYLATSRPATKEELQPGMLVLAMGDASPRSREDLAKTTRWALFRVKDISNLYKGTATLEYNDTYWNTWKEYEYHVNNIRVVLGDFSPEL
ncbi:MAG: hypothetical protein ABIJ86_13570 [Spirochaetota bacterium]